MTSTQPPIHDEAGGFNEVGHHRLHQAVLDDDFTQIKHLLSQGVDVDINTKTRQQSSALHINCCYGAMMKRLRIGELLLDRKANINKQNIDGDTPLILAAYNGTTSMVKLLLERKADRSIRSNDSPWKGQTALDIAKKLGNCVDKEIIAMLEAEPAPDAPPAPFPALLTRPCVVEVSN